MEFLHLFQLTVRAIHSPGWKNRIAMPQQLVMSVCAGPRGSAPNGKNSPCHGVPPSQSAAGLDLFILDRNVQELFSADLARQLHRITGQDPRGISDFAQSVTSTPPFPKKETNLVYFVAWMYGEQLVGSTVKNYWRRCNTLR